MKKLWLIFAQTTTVGLAIWFLATILHPEWLPQRAIHDVVTLREGKTASAPQSVAASATAAHVVTSYSSAAHRAMPAVVNIYTSKEVRSSRHPMLNDPAFRRFFGNDDAQRASSLGSGVIVSDKGYIITNNHVVESADEIEVALADGRTAEAKVVGADPDTDLAVIKVDEGILPPIAFADTDKLQVGDVVLAIGNPFGVGQTVTMGIVSALGRSQLGINTFENFIQTDAPINPGNSGGALVDTDGNLVGINAAIYSQSGGSLGIGFAIPASTVKQVMEAIIKDGKVTRGWLGVEAQDVTPELAASFKLKQAHGALIAGVVRGSPAEKSGIKPGDILLSVAGKDIQDSSAMLNEVAALKPDETAPMHLFRNGKDITLDVKIGRRPRIAQR
ncbi:Do family serine endopeptidase [Silvimonas iriomotensis]|uniref:DegQ protease n=1 Tax=Silvimonas iriomotensis TaxID=449662 RepID=A0ABQ2PD77_9NEIS|nr:Do family serine endopeptidase [Silvimonas iriomotensis]GGP23502.1 DegQ protease [Silvimonas iriomotensis]